MSLATPLLRLLPIKEVPAALAIARVRPLPRTRQDIRVRPDRQTFIREVGLGGSRRVPTTQSFGGGKADCRSRSPSTIRRLKCRRQPIPWASVRHQSRAEMRNALISDQRRPNQSENRMPVTLWLTVCYGHWIPRCCGGNLAVPGGCYVWCRVQKSRSGCPVTRPMSALPTAPLSDKRKAVRMPRSAAASIMRNSSGWNVFCGVEGQAIERAVTAGLEELAEHSLRIGDVARVLLFGHAPLDVAIADLAGGVDPDGARC